MVCSLWCGIWLGQCPSLTSVALWMDRWAFPAGPLLGGPGPTDLQLCLHTLLLSMNLAPHRPSSLELLLWFCLVLNFYCKVRITPPGQAWSPSAGASGPGQDGRSGGAHRDIGPWGSSCRPPPTLAPPFQGDQRCLSTHVPCAGAGRPAWLALAQQRRERLSDVRTRATSVS